MSQWMREFTPGRTQSTNESPLADVAEFAAECCDACGRVAPLFVVRSDGFAARPRTIIVAANSGRLKAAASGHGKRAH
ncbi:MAG: hypothetical protein WBV43_13925, partial [Pseudolabrys sp.]